MYQVVDKTGEEGFSSDRLSDATWWAAMCSERYAVMSIVLGPDRRIKCIFYGKALVADRTFAEVDRDRSRLAKQIDIIQGRQEPKVTPCGRWESHRRRK